MVEELLGRRPKGGFTIALRRDDGSPVVLSNEPLFEDGTPMPTRFWLADKQLVKVIGTLESNGGVHQAEGSLPEEDVARTHQLAEEERRKRLPENYEGPVPSGGVGGTRKGVKCLHAHYANWLMGAEDVVGAWVQARLAEAGVAFDPRQPGIASTKSSGLGHGGRDD